MIVGIVSILGLGLAASLIVLVALALIFAFEVVMFVHVLTNHALAQDRKLLWLVGMLLVHPFVAIAYYFTDYRRRLG